MVLILDLILLVTIIFYISLLKIYIYININYKLIIKESCNFATPNWLKYFINAKVIYCIYIKI